MRIAILGPGGVGGFLAAALARAGEDVTVIGRPDTVSAIRDGGLTLNSRVLGDFTVPVAADETLKDPVPVLAVATKATGLSAALQRIHAGPGLVVPLLNGLDHMARLRERFGADRVVAATIRIESERVAPGRIEQNSPAVRIELASDRAALATAVHELAAALRGAGISVTVGSSEAQILWSKLVRLNALALATSAADRPLGELRRDPGWRSALHDAVTETAAVAAADGAHVAPEATWEELEQAHPGLVSSMQRDITAGRPTELDAIAGAVLRAARRHGLACPTVARLAARVAERASEPAPA
jgi:2-dehydropantoate 2-reductase